MDSLKTIDATTSPLTISATNFPGDLDHAVLRRVPSHLHLGLPSIDHRIQIFHLHLKGEILNADTP